ncbi:MAG TPA: glucosyl-3-phosphoglycerate synthase [Mycobacteriales bacterium]|nr:glucosyl-3-phosphoglycerate synthase [Mycobacteriales bacterium]
MRADARRWFERRTSRAADWPLPRLLAAKGDSRVAVVLPALNEAATVGRIITRIRRDLFPLNEGPASRPGLLDEIVVMDSGSTDRTAEVATDAGARVVHRGDVLPGYPPRAGKGEVLWRSLAATSSDVIVFIDSDLTDFHSAFVTGLLGPLLTDPSVSFVKATYDRPVTGSDAPAGGGRVTELVARPLLNVHWPELAGFVQPLGGEYAARRSLLERLPFPCGYGVEFGLLVDTLRLVGLDAMAQVDLTRRKHRNQDNDKLGRMATEIWLVALARLESERKVDVLRRPATAMTQFERSGAGYRLIDTDIEGRERPPIVSVAGYAAS